MQRSRVIRLELHMFVVNLMIFSECEIVPAWDNLDPLAAHSKSEGYTYKFGYWCVQYSVASKSDGVTTLSETVIVHSPSICDRRPTKSIKKQQNFTVDWLIG